MPIYEYQCESCGNRVEVKQSIKDAPLTTCERCGKSLRRLISSPGIMFKGSGWYVTDYSNKLKPPSEGEKTPAAAGEKKETPTGSGAAPASSPASPPPASTGNATSSAPPAAGSSTANPPKKSSA
ncbi:MAG TPA: FmdB family zinc ribbon protein [Nitrospira sp.]|nr:FmdB family zinc ribbon protein [Nitrospira sp.]